MSSRTDSRVRDDAPTLDYAIVGGGIAGIYCAWRLLVDNARQGRRPSVAIFEASSRLGGRLLSVVPPDIPSVTVELGGMRFIKDVQAWVTKLVEHLGLPTAKLDADAPENFAYLRGKLLRRRDLDDPNQLPYHLSADDRSSDAMTNPIAMSAVRVLAPAIKRETGKTVTTWKELTKLTDDERLHISLLGRYEGTLLRDLPLRYLLQRSLCNEALNLAEDVCGYDSILHTWNAADGYWWNIGDFHPGVKYLRVKSGFARMPLQLAERFSTAGGQINMSTRLVSFDAAPDDGPVRLVVESEGTRRVVNARRLILALPRRSLELIDQTGAVLGRADVQRLIRSVTPIPLFKIALCYPQAWWEDLDPPKVVRGRSTTDLPIRQCYYWGVERKTKRAVVLVYDDGSDLDYWAGLRGQPDSSAPRRGALFELPDWTTFQAPALMQAEVSRQLAEMHGVAESAIPDPDAAAYRDWGEDPFGGGANFWPVGVNSHEVADAIVQPRFGRSVYVCGEAYSHAQGWVEGALATAEQVLRRLGVPKPSWQTLDVS